MYMQYALWFAVFGSLMLVLVLIGINRAAQKDKESSADPNMLTEARKARRATLIGVFVLSIASWVVAAVIYTWKVDINRLLYPHSLHFYITSFVLFLGISASVFFEWKLHQFARRIQKSGETDAQLAQAHETSRKMRWKWYFMWTIMSIVVLASRAR